MADDRNFKEIKEDFQSLLANPGWQRLTKLANEQIHQRREELETNKGETLAELKYMLGEIGATKLFLAIPQIEIESCEAVLKSLPDEPIEETDHVC